MDLLNFSNSAPLLNSEYPPTLAMCLITGSHQNDSSLPPPPWGGGGGQGEQLTEIFFSLFVEKVEEHKYVLPI